MVIRSRLNSLLFRGLAFSCTLILIIIAFIYGKSDSELIGRFGIQAALLVCFAFFLKAIFNAVDLKRHGNPGAPAGLWMPLSLAILSFNLFSGIIYFSYVYPNDTIKDPILTSLFAVAPILALIDYLLFEEKGTVKKSYPLYWSFYPLFFGVFTLIGPLYKPENSFPDTFFDSAHFQITATANWMSGNAGWNGVSFFSLIFLFAFIALSFLLVFFNDLVGGRFKKTAKDTV